MWNDKTRARNVGIGKVTIFPSLWAHVLVEVKIAKSDILLVLLWGEMKQQEALL